MTLFDIAEIARWTRHGESTIRRWISTGKIPSRFLTRPGGRIFMSGDQLAGLIRSWQDTETVAEPPPRRTTRIKRRDPLVAARRGPRRPEPRNAAADR
ncbi:helix-turn-helix domain-containing protein [Rhizocola hellebori]|uniref:helix-turn-helix domain-containing protein n=1 Tax=Rhizocola hellebori TaxID=1392758 RepID=UPI00357112CC